MVKEKSVGKFNEDVETNKGYIYTTSQRLSCSLSNLRLIKAVNDSVNFKGKKIIDIGCGDGTYSLEYLKNEPEYILGVDAAEEAIKCANSKVQDNNLKNVNFIVEDIYKLNSINDHFDIAVIRGVLHHLYDVESAVEKVSHIADEIIVIEPNGYNPVLKIIEKTSKYHKEHEEKSYFPHKLNKMFVNNGCEIIENKYCGLVPFFCSDLFARTLKITEPFIENIPLLNRICCGVCVIKIKTKVFRDK